jgi:CRISPR-associated protein Csy1
VVVLPVMGHDAYLQVNCACDALLDTLRWSGGNTSLDALACGLPMVTLPGALMRGRQTAAMLQMAGVPELVARDADDYVRIAVRLGTDATWSAAQSARPAAGAAAVFDRREPIEALARFLATGST